jgi:very-short-patch-repair endonuclease
LLALTPERRDALAADLSERLQEKRELDRRVIAHRWLKRAEPSREEIPWNRIFQMRTSKYAKSKSLREAVEMGIPEGLLNLRPCWLTNPDTAATILPLRAGLFDIVIFDEASQCPIEQALPIIYRGKHIVVAGDEKQLPPTSFFKPDIAEDVELGDGEEEEATEAPVDQHAKRIRRAGQEYLLQVDNLLDAAVDLLPEEYLRVHYRSEHPGLIEYSNHAFYGGRLEMPPARASIGVDESPIEYKWVEGMYDKRRNYEEARAVIDLLKEQWLSDGSTGTLGVVTFNQVQRDLIEDLIEKECASDSKFAKSYEKQVSRCEGNRDIGFFVKNLENVQGDERDIIVFSTTFGRDENKRFYRRFGPVGARGGERRLNVAVTRAKKKVVIVTSMPVNEVSSALADISVGAGLTPAAYLQLYLRYAQALSQGDKGGLRLVFSILGRAFPAESQGSAESPVEVEVLNAIEAMGYRADCQVGESGFRIDLAVRHPEQNTGYVLGVECDGATYHSGRRARARDVWRESILTSRGWAIHRVWSRTWWNHTEAAKAELKEAIEHALVS